MVIVALLIGIFGPFNTPFSGFRYATANGPAIGCAASGPALALSGVIQDQITGSALGATTTVDVIIPAVSGWNAPYESPTQSSGTWSSKYTYAPCTQFYLHVSSTAGNKYYDALFGPYTTGVTPWQPGTTGSCSGNCVWAQGVKLGLYQETTGANQLYTLTDSLGKSCGTATGSSADSHTAVQAGNVGTNTVMLLLTLQLGSASTAYGVSWPYITAGSGQGGNYAAPGFPGPGTTNLGLTEWYATNRTVGNAWITGQGFTPTTQQPAPTIGTLFYKTLNPVIGSKTGGGIFSQNIPLDLTNGPGSGKRVQTAIWISDNQLPADSANAVTDGAPGAYGAYSAVGPSANTFSFSSFTTASGRWTGYLINCAVTQ